MRQPFYLKDQRPSLRERVDLGLGVSLGHKHWVTTVKQAV